ncbi:site-specific integrase [Rhodococcus antarcticus]|uniref:Site-specific integrase n=1 Tax=Rhodococcus antarcticus TaxID=2987751 RepID=A0ABY6NZS5_9NOCA|nr:hypothetical protein [Rhodococcus antarcticus]UZJ24521.1 site-specific integrase [Rhodococcus antarcticus]
MAKKGVPFDPDCAVAMQKALDRIRTYKGSSPVLDPQSAFVVQQIVLDALVCAPQPVTRAWVSFSLAVTGRLVEWARTVGEDVVAEHLLSAQTRRRFLHLGCGDYTDGTRRNYRSRIDLIANAQAGVVPTATAIGLRQNNLPVEPISDYDVATLWVWAQGAKTSMQREKMAAALVLGLGCGLTSAEIAGITAGDVLIDEHGAHVSVVKRDPQNTITGTRVVTCRAVWEPRLIALVSGSLSPAHTLFRPCHTVPLSARNVQAATADVQHANRPPVWFSPQTLRVTWLVAHLTAGTPLPILMAAYGVKSIEAIEAYLVFVPTPDPAQRAQTLRGGVA